MKLEEVVSTNPRSPLSELALTQSELTSEREVVLFNIHLGEQGVFLVVGDHFEHEGHTVVELYNFASRESNLHTLGDLGVAPYQSGAFSRTNFVVDLNDRDTLPPVVPWKVGEGPHAQSRIWDL